MLLASPPFHTVIYIHNKSTFLLSNISARSLHLPVTVPPFFVPNFTSTFPSFLSPSLSPHSFPVSCSLVFNQSSTVATIVKPGPTAPLWKSHSLRSTCMILCQMHFLPGLGPKLGVDSLGPPMAGLWVSLHLWLFKVSNSLTSAWLCCSSPFQSTEVKTLWLLSKL